MSTLNLGLALLCLTVITSETSALKCWRCSSDATNSQFCNEKLDISLLTIQQQHWHLVECSPPVNTLNIYGEKMVSRCRMQVQRNSINGQKVYSRSCVAEAENAEPNACLVRNVLPEVTVLACETCQHDGCNEIITEKAAKLNAGIKTTPSVHLLSFVVGIVWLFF